MLCDGKVVDEDERIWAARMAGCAVPAAAILLGAAAGCSNSGEQIVFALNPKAVHGPVHVPLAKSEVLGLSWDDIDFDAGTVHVRQQPQRVRRELLLEPVKTRAGKRPLPLLDLARA